MKKYYFALYILIIVILTIACNRTEFKEMRVYPVPKELAIARGAESFIVLQIEIPAGSHVYGNPKGPGTGKPTQIFVQAGDDIQFSAARYLNPIKLYYPNEKEHVFVYEKETKIFIPFRVRDNARLGAHPIMITFDSLLCNYAAPAGFINRASSCIPKIFQFFYQIRVLPLGVPGTRHDQKIISDYQISKPAPKGGETVQGKPETITLSNDTDMLPDLHFIPRFIESGITGLLQAILFGIIAGFILNFMPCVLPVVSLKVMSFVQHADISRRQVFLLGLVFSLGILTSFAVLAALAAFFGLMWGGLFQVRIFLVIMTGFVFALALSLFGVYSITMPAFVGRALKGRANMFADAYVKGLLATILATPCSGPFLGGILAWSLPQQPQIIFTVFMSIGLGMSLPYLILAAYPKFTRLIPKQGEWVKTFEQIMAFLLVFTAVYLIGIFDPASTMPVITFLAFMAVGFWQYGKYGSVIQIGMKRLASLILLIVIIIAGYFLSFNYLFAENDKQEITPIDFTVERLMQNKNNGRISMIEFTADWCPNCRLVEKTSLYTDAVAVVVKGGGIDFMKADITRKNPPAERLLSLFQSKSIPLLAVVPPGKSFEKPIILRDIYSEKDVLAAIDMARKESRPEFKYQVDIQVIGK